MIDLAQYAENTRQLQLKDGIWRYFDATFAEKLDEYLPKFVALREQQGLRVSATELLLKLPFGEAADDSNWEWKRQSMELLFEEIGDMEYTSVLEIGAWNGWLTKLLSRKSKEVLAVDYFDDEADGLGAMRHYSANITALQCNVAQFPQEFKKMKFDLIVLTHCIVFQADPAQYLIDLVPLLNSGGQLLALGTTYFKDPSKKQKEVEAFKARNKKENGFDIYLQPVKAYLDLNDLIRLKQFGFVVDDYPDMLFQNLKSRLFATSARYVYVSYNA